MAPATWHGTRSLAIECYRATNGDYELALLLALDWRDKFREPGPRAQETANEAVDTHCPGACSLADAPSGPPEEIAA